MVLHCRNSIEVVSIGSNPTFKVRLVPMEYIPTIPSLSHYVINICVYLAKRLHFFGSRFYKTTNIYILRDAHSINSICNYKWSLFNIVGIYSIGTNLTLKVGLLPMETTNHYYIVILKNRPNRAHYFK